jgi:hypothetical protein
LMYAVFAVLLLWLWALILDVSGKPKAKQPRGVAAQGMPVLFGSEQMRGATR